MLIPSVNAFPTHTLYSFSFADNVILSAILIAFILATVVGNVFVIVAVYMERRLQSVQYFLIVSLAIADLMVAILGKYTRKTNFLRGSN